MQDQLSTALILSGALMLQSFHDDALIAKTLRRRQLIRWARNGSIALLLTITVIGFLYVKLGENTHVFGTETAPPVPNVRSAPSISVTEDLMAETAAEPIPPSSTSLPLNSDPNDQSLRLRMQHSLSTP